MSLTIRFTVAQQNVFRQLLWALVHFRTLVTLRRVRVMVRVG